MQEVYVNGWMIDSSLLEPLESVEDNSYFNSPTDVISYLGSQLSWSPPANKHAQLWVFWSQQDDDDELRNNSLYPASVDTSNISRLGRIAEHIKACLQHFCSFYSDSGLVQFWAPIENGAGEIYLTTATQPFALKKLDKGLCSYRKQCVQLPSVHVNQLELEHNNNNNLIGLVGRVFRRGLMEYCTDISKYLSQEYPLRDCAMNAGVAHYAVVPLFETPDQKQCIGVLEILMKKSYSASYSIFSILHRLKDGKGRAEATQIVKKLVRAKKIKAAGIWVPSCSKTTRCMNRILSTRNTGQEPSDFCLMWEGEGVVGKAFALRSSCLCTNVCKLNTNVDSQVLNARTFGLTGCFAICLKSAKDNDLFFILEFFLPANEIDPKNFINEIVSVLQEELITTPHLLMPTNKLWVEVIKISPDEDLDSFEICTNEHVGKVVQHNYRPTGPSSRQPVLEHDAVNKEIDVAIEGFDASSKALDQPEINIPPIHQNETIQENPCIDPLPETLSSQILVNHRTFEESHEQSLASVDDLNQEYIIIEDDDINGSKKRGKMRTLGDEYGITREVLEQHSDKKLEDVAVILGVSRSTLKRINRKNGIERWPPCKSKKFRSSFNSQISIEATQTQIGDTTRQMNQPLPDLSSQQQIMPNGKEVSSIDVKATYRDNIMKFALPLSSLKLNLEEEITKRIKLPVKSFKINYLDGDGDWVWLACDDDLRICMDGARSSGKTKIEMSVIQLSS